MYNNYDNEDDKGGDVDGGDIVVAALMSRAGDYYYGGCICPQPIKN